jgi:asparagine synthase (glutamine-hydrolysing)
MCGIAGIFHYRHSGRVDQNQLKRMADSMVHRGPDDEGFYVSGPIGLAHRRLSIIDLKGGHQPMFNEDGSLAIVFNGEIYNHEELRTALEPKGHVYRTSSDTESIVHAYEEFGSSFETHLTGMFAFALWDASRKRLVLSRDRLGIKPLYYTVQGDRLLFASEIKAILTMEGIDRRVDPDALDAYLSLRYVPGPKTMFKDIFKLQPGHTLVVQDGRLTIQPYWDLTYSEDVRDEGQVLDELESLLFEVCRSHLMSEVPYGVFLSGGIDSSSVVAIIRKLLGDRLMTFTVGYEHAAGINEFDSAGLVSRHIGTDHYALTLPSKDFAEWIPKMVWHLDEPVGDAACIPLYFLARYAKDRATVLQSGEGADEIFGGYYLYKKMNLINRLQEGPLFPLARAISQSLLPLGGRTKLARYLRLFALPLEERYRGVSGHFMEGIKQDLANPGAFPATNGRALLSQTFDRYYAQVKSKAPLNQMLFVDTKTWLPDDLLVKADKMTMAASVELRVPFLDHRMVEFAARLPIACKIRNDQTKFLFKKAMEPYLPKEIIYQRKKGFPVPVAEWFRGELYDIATDLLLSSTSETRPYLNPSCLKSLLEDHKAGRHDFSNELWGLLVLEYWFRTFQVLS